MKIIAIEEAFSMDGLRGLPSVADPASSAISIDPQVVEDWKAHLPDVTTLRLADMDAHGVDVQVLSLTFPGIQGIADAETAVEDARAANDYLATVVAAHPDRFRGFAALPLQDPAAAAAELHRCVRELGFCGALVNDTTNGQYLDEPRFEPVWQALETLGVPLYLHPGASVEPWSVVDDHAELGGALPDLLGRRSDRDHM